MIRPISAVAVLAAFTIGCQSPRPKAPPTPSYTPTTQPNATTRPSTRQATTTQPATQSTTQATTQPTTQTAAPANWEVGVSEIITKPVVTTQPTTQRTTEAYRTDTSAEAPLPTPQLRLDDLARIDSSVSTAPLMRLLAMKLNNIPYSRFAGFGVVDFTPNLPEGVNPDAMTNDILAREPAGTSGAIARLAKGEVDLAIVSRPPTQAEIDTAAKAGTKLRSDLVATEALVFTANVNNPINSLSQSQLKRIFTADAKKWSDMKLEAIPKEHELSDKPITVAYRARGLGTEELMEQLLLNGQKLPELPISKALSSTKLVLDATNEDPETLGFSVFCYTTNMERDGRTKVIAVDNVLPEPTRVASGEYPLTSPIYVVTRANLENDSRLYALRRWLTAMPGQKVLAEAGYMPILAEAWTQQRLMSK
ncbi:MAG TPA: substrate-binding domain-containing protein [Tepidisphaeraceae bacterium]|jgi:phosphate transport system substrate-binding protein